MNKFRYFILLCSIIFFVGCGSRSTDTSNERSNNRQTVLADRILQYFRQEQFDKIAAHLDHRANARLNKDGGLAAMWKQLNTQYGKYEEDEFYSIEELNVMTDKVVYICTFGQEKLYFELNFFKGNIAGLTFKPITD